MYTYNTLHHSCALATRVEEIYIAVLCIIYRRSKTAIELTDYKLLWTFAFRLHADSLQRKNYTYVRTYVCSCND